MNSILKKNQLNLESILVVCQVDPIQMIDNLWLVKPCGKEYISGELCYCTWKKAKECEYNRQ